MRTMLQRIINELLSADADAVAGAEYGRPSPDRATQRNGYSHRDLDTRAGTIDEQLMAEWLAPGKLEKDEREHLHGVLGDVSEKIAMSLVTHSVDRAVNNVRTLDRSDSGLIAPIQLG